MRRVLGLGLTVFFALVPSAHAGQPRTHDGLFLRLAGGVASANTTLDPGDLSLELSGIGVDGDFAIGGVIGHNLALHGTVFGWMVPDPNVEFNGEDYESNINVLMGAIGGGLTYYLGPSNLYLSGSVGFGMLDYDSNGNFIDTDKLGVALTALLGKEWWVSENWGLGIAGDIDFHSLNRAGGGENWKGVSFGLLFSATLN